jgi:hypothetical protein
MSTPNVRHEALTLYLTARSWMEAYDRMREVTRQVEDVVGRPVEFREVITNGVIRVVGDVQLLYGQPSPLLPEALIQAVTRVDALHGFSLVVLTRPGQSDLVTVVTGDLHHAR